MLVSMNSPNLLSDALCVNDNVIERVYSYKLFGIVIRYNLKWHDHVDLICAKASSRLHFRSLQTIWCIFTLLKNVLFWNMLVQHGTLV